MRIERIDAPGVLAASWRDTMSGWVNQLGEPVPMSLTAGQSLFLLMHDDRVQACARLVPALPPLSPLSPLSPLTRRRPARRCGSTSAWAGSSI